jgi:three-Cys-motif partner protein
VAQPKTTIWELEPHTSAKHEILRRYLQAWAPILSQGKFPLLVIVDGFAGPGRYSKGEEGSPIIAIKAVIEQQRPISAKVDFHFIELDKRRAEHLATEIAVLKLPRNVTTTIHDGRAFQDVFPGLWNSYAPKPARSRPPTFVFIDPFGFKIPFSYVAKVLQAQSCEVLITFMFEEINRFLSQGRQPDNFDELFGCRDWRDGIKIKVPSERLKFLHDLYQRQLEQSAGARFVRSFAMRNERNTMDYFLFFATNHELGLRKMKEAMWQMDKSGTYTFSDATDPNQSVLFTADPDRRLLSRLIVGRFAGQETILKDVEQFVVCETPFRETHYKKVLKELEEAGQVAAVGPPANRKRGQFGDPNMKLRFKPARGP